MNMSMGPKLEIIRAIGRYYLDKNNHNYEETYKDIRNLNIHSIDLLEQDTYTQVNVLLERPGVLIGCKGENINALEEFLFIQTKKRHKIHLIEEKELQWLYPVDWSITDHDDCDFDF